MVERGDRLLDRLQRVLTVGRDARRLQLAPGLIADLGTQDRLATGQGANGLGERRFCLSAGIPAGTIQIHLAHADETYIGGVGLVDQELAGVAEVLIDHPAAGGRHRHQDRARFLLGPLDGGDRDEGLAALLALGLPVGLDGGMDLAPVLHGLGVIDLHGLDLVQREFVPPILTQHPHRVRPALAAVAHHIHIPGAGVLQGLKFLMGGSALAHHTIEGAVLGLGNQRHHIVQEGPLGLDHAADFFQVLVVHTGDQDRIDLDQHAARHQHLQTLLLLLDQDRHALAALDPAALPEDPGIDFDPYVRVHTVDGDGHMVDVVRAQFIHHVRECQPIGGDAQLDVRGLFRQLAEGVQGAPGVGQWIAGAGNAEHRHLGNIGGHRDDLLHRLIGGEDLGDDARARLIGTVVFAVAIMTLDIAGGGHRHMHACIVVMGLLRITGMVVDLGADMLRQVRKRIAAAAATA